MIERFPLSISTPSGIGIIGAGAIAELHANAIAAAGHRLVAVCDVRDSAAAALARPHDADSFADHRNLLREPDVDAVIITVPHALHASIALDAIRAGKHVLIEKPIAIAAREAHEVIAAAADANVTVAVGHVLRFVPSLIVAHELITAGAIGKPVLMVERRASNYASGSRPAWFFDPLIAGGGILLNVGTHAIDRVQWLGGSHVTRVHGFVSARPGAMVETESTALLELANGVRASVTVTGTGLPFIEDFSVVGETGAITIDREHGVRLFKNGELRTTIEIAPNEMTAAFTNQLTDFVDASRENRPPRVDAAYGLAVLNVAHAIYESSRQQRPVDLPVDASTEVAA